MGESQRDNMMGQRVFIIALMASFCVALPTTDLVVPEAKDAGTTGAEFVQSTLKSGGTETQCRTFATETISSINSGVTSEQGTLAAIDTGAGCAQEGQSGVATATTNKETPMPSSSPRHKQSPMQPRHRPPPVTPLSLWL